MVVPALKRYARGDTVRNLECDLDGDLFTRYKRKIVVRVMNWKNSRVIAFLVFFTRGMNREIKEESNSIISSIQFSNLKIVIALCETTAYLPEKTRFLLFLNFTCSCFCRSHIKITFSNYRNEIIFICQTFWCCFLWFVLHVHFDFITGPFHKNCWCYLEGYLSVPVWLQQLVISTRQMQPVKVSRYNAIIWHFVEFEKKKVDLLWVCRLGILHLINGDRFLPRHRKIFCNFVIWTCSFEIPHWCFYSYIREFLRCSVNNLSKT